MQGKAVTDLQDALQLFLEQSILPTKNDVERNELSGGLKHEQANHTYGEVTSKLVSRFQDEQKLQPTGEVDEPTAKALNAILEKLGALDTVQHNGQGIISGQVIDSNKKPLTNITIIVSYFDDTNVVRLGQDKTDIEGRYTIQYELPSEVQTVNLRLAVFNGDQKPYKTEEIKGAKPLESRDFVIDGATPVMYQVDGKVMSRISASVEGLRVQIVTRAVGKDVSLKETNTDKSGSYQVTFFYTNQPKNCPSPPDLQAHVYAGNTLLGSSEVRYNAKSRETLHVILDEKASASLKSEYETLTDTLSCHVKGKLADLKENEKQKDITYLANKTGWDARAVALAALADQFSTRTANNTGVPVIPPPFFYALFRAGLPANEETLYHTDAETVERVWKQAVEQGVIPKASDNQVPGLVNQFQTLGSRQLLSDKVLIGASSLKAMLAVSHLDEKQQEAFAQLYAKYRTDLPAFWKQVEQTFGPDTAKRLQTDGKLGFLTINNAPLMQKVHAATKEGELSHPLQLAALGYHKAASWSQLLTEKIPVPKEIPGDTVEAKRINYANYLAAQVRLSYPTAAIAQLVESGELPLTDAPEGASKEVHAFLTQHQDKFEIGINPVDQYIAQNKLEIPGETRKQLKRIQRVYQITPSDQALTGLMKHGIDAAYHVVKYDKETFVKSFAGDMGGEHQAALTYDKSVQVHNTILNLALGYLHAQTAPAVGVHSPASVINPVGDVIAMPALESLFGSMDFCECAHCRSLLSPAAYLVDLLQFLHADEREWEIFCARWRSDHSAPYPFRNPAEWEAKGRPENTEISPLNLLLSRRPDIEHLPLTCENTNTALPYIDIVNETLEYYIATVNNRPRLSLTGYEGHDTDDVESGDLLASPQFVNDSAYEVLKAEPFPHHLPFHQPLENLRRYFTKFEVPLPLAMERLRRNEDLQVNRTADPQPPLSAYGWVDILMEEMGLSRAAYKILTDASAIPLSRMYGYPPESAERDVIASLSNAKRFALRVGISYEDLVAVLKTQFINPHGYLIPKLERLGVSFAELKAFKEGGMNEMNERQFDDLLRTRVPAPDPSVYGGNIKAWVRNEDNYARIMGLITLTDPSPSGSAGSCDFSRFEFRYSRPANTIEDTSNRIGLVEFVRLLRFIRLWKKLGWTIEQTDAAICALYRADMNILRSADIDTVQKLDEGFRILLPRLGIVLRIMKALALAPDRDLLPLLACWSGIGTYGAASLYRKMFLNPTLLKQDDIFSDNGYGEFLQLVKVPYLHPAPVLEQSIVDAAQGKIGYDAAAKRLSFTGIMEWNTLDALQRIPGVSEDFRQAVGKLYQNQRLKTHAEAVRSAFNLTGEEYELIVARLDNYDDNTPLTLTGLSKVFSRGWLARTLKLSVRELLLFIQLTGLDPFTIADPAGPALVRLVELVQLLRDRSVSSSEALYLIWDQDLSGKSAPAPAQIQELASTLRMDFAGIDDQFKVIEDPDGDLAHARVATGYGQETSDTFFSLLNESIMIDVTYTHPASQLETAITSADPRIAYDAFRRRLSHKGLLTSDMRDRLNRVAAGNVNLLQAIGELFLRSEDIKNSFFTLHPELRPAYDNVLRSDQTLTLSIEYIHPAPALEPAIVAVDNRIAYDHSRHRLSCSGFLTAARRDILKAVPGTTPDFKIAVDGLFAQSQQGRSAVVLQYLNPGLIRRRKQQQALQRIGASIRVDANFTETLLDPASGIYSLHATTDPGKPGLYDVLQLETPGLLARFYYRDTATGEANREFAAVSTIAYAPGGANTLPANPAPGAAISGKWSGWLEIPETGYYNFMIETDPGAVVTVSLEGQQNRTTVQNGRIWRNSGEPLSAGTLYKMELKVEQVRNTVIFKWETPQRAREVVPSRYLYPLDILASFSGLYTRFLKTASLAARLKLTANEIAWFAVHRDYRINDQGQLAINGDGWLNVLPIGDNPDPATPVAHALNASLVKPLQVLLHFSRIKAAVSSMDESLLNVLKDPVQATQNTNSLLFTITQWNQASLYAVLSRIMRTRADLEHFDVFLRVYGAFSLIRQMGISAEALIGATTNEPTSDTVRSLQAALRARYDTASWREVVQPINDQVRTLQRDALVAYILHQMRSHPDSEHINTPEKLFEYFLMDVQMEPCMQTSRIRHALSSVQLFIERCLMNLEPRVSAAAIDAKQWEWMKRYRVWEANRKVYLFPENWLEPELRPNRSAACREMESELLQGDITEERAATALLKYLGKLEEVAKLEPCGIYHDENKQTDHVVARTSGGNRKYYYRRKEGGFWTPWEQINLDIEGNPVIPVVWNDRLFLFWLRVLYQPPLGGTPVPIPERDDPSFGNVVRAVQANGASSLSVSVQAILCYSEYYNGAWQTVKTSDVSHPTVLGNNFNLNDFDRSRIQLRVFQLEDKLKIVIAGYSSFLLYNTHSLPIRREDDQLIHSPVTTRLSRYVRMSGSNSARAQTLSITYSDTERNTDIDHSVLTSDLNFSIIEPLHHTNNPWSAPFFFEDSNHVFFVKPETHPMQIQGFGDIGLFISPGALQEVRIPSLVFANNLSMQDILQLDNKGIANLDPGFVDPSPLQPFVTEDINITRFIGTSGMVMYDGRPITAMGGKIYL